MVKQLGLIDCTDDCNIDGDRLDLDDKDPVVIIDGTEVADMDKVFCKLG